MIVVDVLLAANLAVLAILVVADRSRSHGMSPGRVLAAARLSPRKADKSPSPVTGCDGVVIPFDRAARRSIARSIPRHPAAGGLRTSHSPH